MRSVYTVGRYIERTGQWLQGKGGGACPVTREIRALKKLLRGQQITTLVDVGGNVGDWTAVARREFPDARVWVIEPAGVNVAKLQARFAQDSHVQIVRAALSDSAGSAQLYSDAPGSGMGTLLQRDVSHLERALNVVETVQTITITEFWTQLPTRRVSILKMDIEGNELSVLRSGGGRLFNNVDAFQFEFGGCNIDAKTHFRDFWTLFSRASFKLFRITPFGTELLTRYREADEHYLTSNFIAVAPHIPV